MKNNKIGFIGAGNIASAIIGGILKADYIIPENIFVFDVDEDKKLALAAYGVSLVSSAKELAEKSDFVFLTVKPQVYPVVLEDIKAYSKDKCFIDVAAGITIDFVKKVLGQDTAVIRVMPNTPLTVGCGSAALVKGANVTEEQFIFVKEIFSSSGVSVSVEEKHINTVTAISGSSPAFILQFAKNIIDFAVSKGMTKKDAETLVLNTFIGSAKLAMESKDDIETLIENVTSPGGTTAAGRKALNSLGFDETINSCLEETVKRAIELTK